MNFWNQLESQQITREQLQPTLFKKLGSPANELQANLAQEILKKITSYYFSSVEEQNYTTHSLIGSIQEISERIRKTGQRKGQVDYNLKLNAKEILQARQEDLTEEKWTQITKLAILGQNLVFKYKKYFANKQVLDFYPPAKTK